MRTGQRSTDTFEWTKINSREKLLLLSSLSLLKIPDLVGGSTRCLHVGMINAVAFYCVQAMFMCNMLLISMCFVEL